MERAFVHNLGIIQAGNAPGTVSANADVTYFKDEELPVVTQATWQEVTGASPRQILEALVAGVIVYQPVGYSLQEKDIVVPSIERG